jgi:hypothetical protein
MGVKLLSKPDQSVHSHPCHDANMFPFPTIQKLSYFNVKLFIKNIFHTFVYFVQLKIILMGLDYASHRSQLRSIKHKTEKTKSKRVDTKYLPKPILKGTLQIRGPRLIKLLAQANNLDTVTQSSPSLHQIVQLCTILC